MLDELIGADDDHFGDDCYDCGPGPEDSYDGGDDSDDADAP